MTEASSLLIDQLVAIRKAKKMSQAELANACNCAQAAIARMEKKRSAPTLETLSRIVHALDCRLQITPN